MTESVRVARALRREQEPSPWWRAVLGALFIMLGLGLVARRNGADEILAWALPAVLFLAALVLVWSPLDGAVQADARRPDVVSLFSREVWARVVSGVVLAAVSLIWLSQWDFGNNPLLRMIAVPILTALGAALVLAPWWMRLLRQVGVERERRVREFERAEIAAHLHDSVLQTLTLIRAKAQDPETVARLARAQERDLRAYLYQERKSAAESIATTLVSEVSEVEDAYGVAIDVVSVGDAPVTAELAAAISAAREATANAARHGKEPISVFAELKATVYDIYVRDSGPGFDPSAVGDDRAGIRNSIVGRAARHGGFAQVSSQPGGRTEVVISMPRKESK